jgi:pimeloyl-ACP methyl ester carboxylesterase
MVTRVILLLFLNTVGMALIVVFLGNRLVFYPSRHPEGTWSPEGLGNRFHDVTFSTDDGCQLHGWWLPADAPETLLWCHGNSGNITHRLDLFQKLTSLDVRILLFDYRGYGKSEGLPDEEGLYRDARAAYRFLTDTKNISPDDLYLFGRSLGGAVATKLATEVNTGGLILESTFTSIPEMSGASMPIPYLYLLLRTKMDSLSRIHQVEAPALHMHGQQDEVIPISLGRRLFERSSDPKAWVEFPEAGHDNVHDSDPARYREAMQCLIKHDADFARLSPADDA